MPVYTYRCQNCGVQFEKTQKFNAKPLTHCPECRTGKVKRLLQRTAIIFKGSGWYVSDQSKSAPNKSDSQPTKIEKQSAHSEA